jgi:hypothetical protein
MTETAAFIAGGLTEAKNLLNEAILSDRKRMVLFGIAASVMFGLSAYLWLRFKRRLLRYPYMLDDYEKAINGQVLEMPENGGLCITCQRLAASVVFGPCNHMCKC